MVTKEEVAKARADYRTACMVRLKTAAAHAAADAAGDAAWDKYINLKERYENGN